MKKLIHSTSIWLRCVMSVLSQGQSTFRAKAVKSLASIVDADISLMDDQLVKLAVQVIYFITRIYLLRCFILIIYIFIYCC